MANYNSLKATVNVNIKANNNQEITGPILNSSLIQMINALGAGYQFMGVATPSTNPGSPDYNVFYLASTEGTYINFNNIEVVGGELAILRWNGSWVKFSTGANTQDTLLNRYFIGKGNEFSDTKIYGLRPGRRYQVVLPPESEWDMTGVTSPDNRFAVSNWYGGNYTPLVYFVTSDSLPAYVNFTVPENSDYVAIGGRAKAGFAVHLMIIDISLINGGFDIIPEYPISGLLMNRYFIGKGDWFSDTKIYGLRPGRRYQVVLPPESKWDMTGVTSPYFRFAVSNWYGGGDTPLAYFGTGDSLPAYMDFTVPENSDYVAIGGRAAVGAVIKFMVIDITNSLVNGGFNTIPEYPITGLLMNRYFIGNGDEFSDTKLYGLRPGRRYQVVLPPESKWDMTGVTSPYNRFAVSNWYGGSDTLLANVLTSDSLPAYVNFTVPENSDYVAIGGRAAVGAVIIVDVVDITNDLSLINGGFNIIPEYPISGLLMNRYFIGNGDEFSDTKLYGLRPGRRYQVVLPPESKWDMTGVTSPYFRFAVSNWYGGSDAPLAYVATGDSLPAYVDFTVPENSDYVAIGGRAAVGAVIKFMVVDITATSGKREKLEVAKKRVTTGCGNQGLTKIGDKIIQFDSAADDHSEYANLLIWNATDYAVLTNMEHNLGHAATADYNEDADALIVANGSSDVTIAPRIDIITNAAAKIVPGQRLSYNDNDIIHIELKTDLKEIGGSGLICTFGGNWRIVYLATGQNAPRKIFRCILGVGSEDFSDPTGTDVTRWGTYISGKSDTEYNGTLKVLSTYLGDETEVFQGMCYRNGNIYLACGYTTPLVHKIALYSDGFRIVQTNLPIDYAADGNEIECEPEGLCFVDKDTMLVGLPVYGGLYTIDAF